MNTELIVLLYSAGIIQTLILGAVILKKKKLSLKSNQILLGLLGSILIVLAQYALAISSSGFNNRFLGELATIFWFGLGPLYYLYTLSRIKPDFKIRRWQWLLFLVPAYNLLQYTLSLIQPGIALYFFFDNDIVYSYAWLMAYLLHTLLFVVLAVLAIRKHPSAKITPLLNFFYLWLGILISATIYLLFKVNSSVYFYQIEIYLVVVFNVFVLMLTFRSLLSTREFDSEEIKELKYSNSGLSEKELEILHSKLVSTMGTEKPYMDRKLNLAQLAQISDIRENQLSQVFSQHLNSSFYDFISQYRLTEVEQRLSDPKYAHLKIISLAEDCGFNSKAAFYKTFKEKHHLTPTQYLKQLKAS